MRKAAVIVLLSEERAQLMQLARSKTVSVRLARRAQIVLGAADGLDNETIAAQVGVGRVQVGRWRERYAEGGLAGIEQDLPRGGRPVKVEWRKLVRADHADLARPPRTGAHARWRRSAGGQRHDRAAAYGARTG